MLQLQHREEEGHFCVRREKEKERERAIQCLFTGQAERKRRWARENKEREREELLSVETVSYI